MMKIVSVDGQKVHDATPYQATHRVDSYWKASKEQAEAVRVKPAERK